MEDARMFVLSVEGPGHIDKGNWTTHEVLGVFPDFDAAVAAIPADIKDQDDEIILVTNMDTMEATRIENLSTEESGS
jgi:hypothetical protein